MEPAFRIIWPERRLVSADQIHTWYDDAVANEEVDEPELTDPADMARALDDAGLITLGA